jgi:hypothetical protein
MTARDRLMLMGIAALAVLGALWLTAVAPERQKSSKVTAEVESARQRLSTAESQESSASSARAQYSRTYASLVSLGQAVPATTETPALIYMLDKASHRRDVQFSSITSSSAGTSSGNAAGPTPATQSTGFTTQSFTFVFDGSFVDLYKLLNQLEGFTVQTPSGPLHVKGRLLTIDSVNLAPDASGAQGSSASSREPGKLTGTIAATAYVLPAGQSTLAGATPAGPTGAPATSVTSTASSTTTAGTPAAAVVKVTP